MIKHSHKAFDALALLSGGLDSILAARLVQEQGIRVLGLHFVSPFFGKPHKLAQWEERYNIPITAVDVSEEFVNMLCKGPRHGLGKTLNPCVDCKILMLSTAREMLGVFRAGFIISGEVLGQRPMSQRLDALNIIKRDSGVKNILVRALSARRLPPTDPEVKGIINREKLGSISGRGRKEQLQLAEKFNIRPIPTPGGGCLLTEKEAAKRYLPLFRHIQKPRPGDFYLANTGRQIWNYNHWLCIGRNKDDNLRLNELAGDEDYLFSLTDFPGPLGLGRTVNGKKWSPETIKSAAALVNRFSPKSRQSNRQVKVLVKQGGTSQELLTRPQDPEEATLWTEPIWDRDEAKLIATQD